MTQTSTPVLMIGSVPARTAEEALRAAGTGLGDLLIGISDGEPRSGSPWTLFNAPEVFEPHPALETVSRPGANGDEGSTSGTGTSTGLEGRPAARWEQTWRFRVRDGVEKLHLGNLHYAALAEESYATFRKLREAELIPPGPRFQVSLPLPEDLTRGCTATDRDFTVMRQGVEDALAREVDKLVAAIPHQDLAIQWHACWEALACAAGDPLGREPLAFRASGDPFERFAGYIERLSPRIPEPVLLGLHLCYGDLGHTYLIEPRDLGVSVRMANLAVAHAGRRVDYVHMPVPRRRSDDAYFAPLRDLRIGSTTLFIGVVHLSDGKKGSLQRLATFRHYYRGPYGIATECGWGGYPPQTLPALMQVHRDVVVADRLF